MPAYIEIAEDIRHRITSGELAGGDRLPTERELCERWDVSPITVRKALESLRADGLIYGVRGKGTFVRKPQQLVRSAPKRYWRPHTKATFLNEAKEAGRAVTVQADVHRTYAPGEVADRLGIERGTDVQRITYLIRMDEQPVSSSVCWEPLALTGGTEIEDPTRGPLANTGIVPRFDSIGVHVDAVREALHVRMPTADEADTLDIPPGVPVIAIDQAFRAGDIVVQVADIVFAADRYRLEYDMEIK